VSPESVLAGTAEDSQIVSQGQVWGTVKFTPDMLDPFSTAVTVPGLNTTPAVVTGATVYLPTVSPVKVKFPDESATTLEPEFPLSATVAPAPPVTVPLMVNKVCTAVKLTLVTAAPLTVMG
jgi:hypothetical protein